jgi:hypothetical protein
VTTDGAGVVSHGGAGRLPMSLMRRVPVVLSEALCGLREPRWVMTRAGCSPTWR